MSEDLYSAYTGLTPEEAARYLQGTQSQPVRAEIARRLEGCPSIIEVGCGPGLDASRYPAESYLGIDISEPLLVEARKNNPRHVFRLVSPEGSWPLAPGACEALFSKSVLEHLPSQQHAEAMIRQMLQVARRRVLIAWHTLPRPDGGAPIQVRGHEGRTIFQSRWHLEPILALLEEGRMDVSRHAAFTLWDWSRT